MPPRQKPSLYRDGADRAHPRFRVRWEGSVRSLSIVAIWDNDVRLPLYIRLEAGQFEIQAEDTSDDDVWERIGVVIFEFLRAASRQVRARRQ